MINNEAGEATFPTLLNPVNVIRFSDRLVSQYGLDEYAEMRDQAFDYLMGIRQQSLHGPGVDLQKINPHGDVRFIEMTMPNHYIGLISLKHSIVMTICWSKEGSVSCDQKTF